MDKGIVYYTHNKCDEKILRACRKQIDKCDLPVVSVSQQPLDWGENIVANVRSLPRDLAMFKQQLIGLEAISADVVFFCEHDVLYHPSHFEYDPAHDVYCFNINVWVVDADSGQAMHYKPMRMTSGLVAYTDILIEHYTKKIEWVEHEGFSRRKIGYEPGKHVSKKYIGNYDTIHFISELPNIDVKHGGNITRKRFVLDDFNNKNKIKDSWVLADEVPYWGKTKGQFNRFVEGLL